MAYKTIIKIEGRCIDDLFRLPCVSSITKEEGLTVVMNDGLKVHIGDSLCEDYDGKWGVLSEKEA